MSVFLETVPANLPLVVARHRHLKWKALDPLERVPLGAPPKDVIWIPALGEGSAA